MGVCPLLVGTPSRPALQSKQKHLAGIFECEQEALQGARIAQQKHKAALRGRLLPSFLPPVYCLWLKLPKIQWIDPDTLDLECFDLICTESPEGRLHETHVVGDRLHVFIDCMQSRTT